MSITDELCAETEGGHGEMRLNPLECALSEAQMLREQVAALQAENVKLCEDLEFERSENGWVREFLDRMGQKCGTEDCPSLVAYVTKLEGENAKLQELVRDIYEMAWYEYPSAFEEKFADRMQQLRIDERR